MFRSCPMSFGLNMLLLVLHDRNALLNSSWTALRFGRMTHMLSKLSVSPLPFLDFDGHCRGRVDLTVYRISEFLTVRFFTAGSRVFLICRYSISGCKMARTGGTPPARLYCERVGAILPLFEVSALFSATVRIT